MKVLVNILSRDVDAQLAFYQQVFGFAEIAAVRSPIYRALDTGATELGFNAFDAYALLGLDDRQPQGTTAPVADVYATFVASDDEAVNASVERVRAAGGRVIKAPFRTYYGAWQAVLEDPEGHVFRVSKPAG